MLNIEEMTHTAGQTKGERKTWNVSFSTMNLTYAYGQLPISPKTKCNFSLVGGKSTGTYSIKTGFYGLRTMPAKVLRTMDAIISEILQFHHFIDDNLFISKGSEVEHIITMEKILKKVDNENMSPKLNH